MSSTLVREVTFPLVVQADEALARRELRRQIARLERRLTDLVLELGVPVGGGYVSDGPRLLGVAGLERRRDHLVRLVARGQAGLAQQQSSRAAARERLEAMIADPARHRFARVSLAELGQPGCGVYQVRPRLGLVGMLAGWWEVKLSSGCPLAGGGFAPSPSQLSRSRTWAVSTLICLYETAHVCLVLPRPTASAGSWRERAACVAVRPGPAGRRW